MSSYWQKPGVSQTAIPSIKITFDSYAGVNLRLNENIVYVTVRLSSPSVPVVYEHNNVPLAGDSSFSGMSNHWLIRSSGLAFILL